MLAVGALTIGAAGRAVAQAEVAAWGNVEGIRVQGQVVPFETSLCAVEPGGEEVARTAKERQRPRYTRSGPRRTVATRLGALFIEQGVEDTGPGTARLDVRFSADSVASAAGGYLCVDLPRAEYAGASVQVLGSTRGGRARLTFPAAAAGQRTELLRTTARGGIRITTPKRRLEITFTEPTEVVVRGDSRRGDDDYRIYLAVLPGPAEVGRAGESSFTLSASEEIDRTPMTMTLDASRPGRAWDGLGGNFRIQNPALDPKVIDYNLANLRLAWGRVEMPWRLWHPDESVDPAAAAPEQLNPRVRQSMEMARTLAQKGMPVIVSIWFPPQWAALGPIQNGPQAGGVWGNALNPAKTERIYQSIASYLLYLKQHYGVEAVMFSFNESDLGIDVRQTAQEHAELIKGLGAFLASRGLATKMLLGDTSDANPTDFIGPAMEDPATWHFIAGVSFHSWRGWSDELLTFWGEAAKKLNVPLLVGEGSTDAGAWRYPAIFSEPRFALEEIDLYTRMLALSQPKSILQWQLTADYSLLIGGGVLGDSGELRPTQRFWNLKQLAATPAGFFLPVGCERADVSCAALGDIANGTYTVHVVNNGAARPTTLSGIPAGVRELRVWVTDQARGMVEGPRIPVTDGTARFTLDPASFTTLMADR